jgi:hypothetical protein
MMPSRCYQFLLDAIKDPGEACIEWPYTLSRGYGQLSFGRRRRHGAHVVAYAVANNLTLPLPDGTCVMHACDNKRCFNPRHLRAGTPKDNTWDAMAKGRLANGTAVSTAKLTEDDVRFIRENYVRYNRSSGLGTGGLARRFGVVKSTIHRIIAGKGWNHVK